MTKAGKGTWEFTAAAGVPISRHGRARSRLIAVQVAIGLAVSTLLLLALGLADPPTDVVNVSAR